MEDILYLVHSVPNKKTLDMILESGCLKASDFCYYQFPGVFFSMITKANLKTERLFTPAAYLLVFSRNLLKQKNYHFNYFDMNGIITSKTLFAWNIERHKEYESIENKIGNEIVFHDDISLDHLCRVIEVPAKDSNMNLCLPTCAIENNATLDMEKLPFVVYIDYRTYSGIDLPFYDLNDESWLRKMCAVANLGERADLDEVKKVLRYYHTHREIQNFDALLKCIE
jgi:hypothetical protein